jgi:tetratricopeptide (TPR) repeat protein
MMRVSLFIFVLPLAACVSAPPTARPAAEEAAIVWDMRGQDAFRRGEWREALAAYEQSLRQYVSVENADGVAVELLNAATVQLKLGDRVAARSTIDQLFDDRGLSYSQRYRAEAAYRRAFLEFEAGDVEAATRWIEHATSLCTASCESTGRLQNLRARVALANEQFDAADAEARRGLDINRGRADNVEQANSLRLLAQASARRGSTPQAQVSYEQALALDKAIGDPYKIALDLLGIGNTLLVQGRQADAIGYFRRAADVARSIGDATLTREAESGLTQARR